MDSRVHQGSGPDDSGADRATKRSGRRGGARERPTVQDLADELGVSTATISRALNGHPHVNEETRARVVAAAARVGYQPNVLARALRQEHSRLVGLIVPDVRSEFFATAISVLQTVLTEKGYRLILGVSADDPAIDRDYVETMIQHRVEGIVHVPCTERGAAAYLADIAKPPPVVEFLRHSESESSDIVTGDEEVGAALIAQHMVELGHRRVAVIAGPERFSTSRSRATGFAVAAREAGAEVDVRYAAYAHEAGHAAIHELMAEPRPPTGVFAAGNLIVSGALQAIGELGLELPRDLSLAGADNPDWFMVTTPGITTYALPLAQMGMIAAQTLVGRMSGDATTQPVGRVQARLTGRLVLRGSCGPVPAGRARRRR